MSVDTYTTAGTFQWACPTGVSSVAAVCIGGSAGGIINAVSGGGGGGGGAEAEATVSVTAGNNYEVIVGAAGAANEAGADSKFNSTSVVAKAGSVGSITTGGVGGLASGSTGTVKRNGGTGGNGHANGGGGGGGGSAGTAAAGNNGTASSGINGAAGGIAVTGGGGGGAGANSGGTGTAGSAPGGGGGGSGTLGTGGAGAAGKVTLTYTAVVTPVADFTGTPVSGNVMLSVVFTDTSTNTPTSWLWEKNSGSGWSNFATTPTAQNPTESFAAGTWSVRMTATNAAGSDTETKTDYVAASLSSTSPQGPNNASAAVNNTDVGDDEWMNPTNVFSSNDVRATAALAIGETTNRLDVTGFGFAVPTTATIDGITVAVERSCNLLNMTSDNLVRLLKAGAVAGSNKATGTAWPTTDAVATYGSATDLWGTTWTPAQVNASDFGVTMQAAALDDGGISARVDHVTITVHYTAAAAASTDTARLIGGKCY